MNVNNKSSVIITLFFALLFIKLDYAFILKESNNLKLLQRFKKRCQNKSINSIRFSKKCHSLGMLNNNEISEKKNSVIMLSNSSKFDYNKIENLIVFGDSHSSVNTNFIDMSYSGNSHSRGKNWPLHLLDFNNKLKLLNFASSGAVVDSNIAFHRNNTIDFLKQYKLFYEKTTFEKKSLNEWNSYNTLFVIYIGTNDIYHINHKCKNEHSIFCTKNNKSVIDNINNIIDIIFNIIYKLYNIGARNILIFTISPKRYILNNYLKNDVLNFNNNIIEKSKYFFKKHSDINFIIYNTADKFKDIISNCNMYKLKNCTNMWKLNKEDNLSDYLWFDSHLTDHGNKILAEDINYLLSSLNN
ncbi:hypothetical protein LY90DRAFT_505306 [Neocallimastix californiae]|uniref:SGNH hydrolase n=1 Tax=Neocallimastix californiae TaxID=1754190 RepID=A0A1Y2DYC6_9FUNG|nr:hypothetical protein LY90DRAFT_505306 [Neocallimastix californiae]|eukprot:ORY63645.1 hypothetical protein LY90DRAFT_505306 [Neocallimastix californiae]